MNLARVYVEHFKFDECPLTFFSTWRNPTLQVGPRYQDSEYLQSIHAPPPPHTFREMRYIEILTMLLVTIIINVGFVIYLK